MKVLTVNKRYFERKNSKGYLEYPKDKIGYYSINIVIQAEDEDDSSMLDYYTKEYVPCPVITDIDKYEECINSDEYPTILDSVNASMKYMEHNWYVPNQFHILKKCKKENVYLYIEYVIKTPTVDAILHELDYYLAYNEGPPLSRFDKNGHLIRLIKCLHEMWD